jgi:hypothetical protein
LGRYRQFLLAVPARAQQVAPASVGHIGRQVPSRDFSSLRGVSAACALALPSVTAPAAIPNVESRSLRRIGCYSSIEFGWFFVIIGYSPHAFSSRLSSLKKRQSVFSAMIFCGVDLMRPSSYRRSA